ncbi:hypothetical protein PYCCODRAFT_1432740 [Trametes coccinea BRFM310]|uniref:Uncharacterized protein n=1 Tax=Trametes coccinea (strain BRFM310) TaxID=1353009 RepID=A0A1Y2IV82_TRAC3|nr:hypothetical protein PYCCODRAFT_1432740 [Trametes coccinea BRFM310]
MPVRRARSASTGNCQVVPADGELPCTQPGYREHPRLCNVHRKEYGQLTAAYKATSEEAEMFYAEVRAREASVDASNAFAVDDALELVRMCVDKIDKEIRERQEHHRRFFVELDDGHEAWIEGLRKKRQIVENTAAQISLAHVREMAPDRWQTDHELFPPLPRQRTYSSQVEMESMSWTTLTDHRRSSTSPSYATLPNAPSWTHAPVTLCRARLRLEHQIIGGGIVYCSAPADGWSRWCAEHQKDFEIALYHGNKKISDCNELGEAALQIERAVRTHASTITLAEVDRHIEFIRHYLTAIHEVVESGRNLERFTGPAPYPYIPPLKRSAALVLIKSLENIQASLLKAHQRLFLQQDQPREGRFGSALLVGLLVGSMAAWFGMSSIASWLIGGAAVLVLS